MNHYYPINKKSNTKAWREFIYLAIEVRDNETFFETKVWVKADGRTLNLTEDTFNTEREAVECAADLIFEL